MEWFKFEKLEQGTWEINRIIAEENKNLKTLIIMRMEPPEDTLRYIFYVDFEKYQLKESLR